jgi:hypothetical protein
MTFIEGTNDMATHDRNPHPPHPRIVLLLIPLIAAVAALGCDDSKPKPSGGMTAVDTAGGLPGLLGGLKPMMSMNPVMTPTNPVMTPMIPPGELTCAAFVKCGNDCPDDDAACYQSCQSRTSAKGRAEYDAVVACAKANMCSESSCLQEKCAMVVGTCLGVVVQPPPPPPPPMTLTCEGIIKCWNGCPENDEACLDACFAKGSTKGRTDLNALLACGKTNMCQDSACLQQKCAPLFAACQSGTTPPPPPMTLTCEGIIKCWNGCPENDEACLDACFAKGSAKGRTDLNALLACGKTNMCQDSGCLQQKCAPLFAACQSGTTPPPPPPPPMTLACEGIIKCWNGCPENDEACLDACFAKGSAKGRTDLNALLACGKTNMCQDSACLQQKCAPLFAACQSGTTPPPPPPPPPGQLTCAGVFTCWESCGNDDACAQACVTKASTKGRADLDALVACGNANMCKGVAGCLQQKCAPQLAACGK